MNSFSPVPQAHTSHTHSPIASAYSLPRIPDSSPRATTAPLQVPQVVQPPSTSASHGVLNRLVSLSRGISVASSAVQIATAEDSNSKMGTVARAREFADKTIELYQFISSQGQELGLSISLDQDPDKIALDIGKIGEAFVHRELVPLLKREVVEVLTDRFGISVEGASDLLGVKLNDNQLAGTPTSQGAFVGGQILGAAGVAYTTFDLIRNYGRYSPVEGAIRGGVAGAYVGTNILPGVGTFLGGLIGGVGGFLGGLFSRSGKSKEQKERDQIRNSMKQAGIIDQDNSLTLADGTKYDIGKDGGHTIPNLNGGFRRAFEIDASNPLSEEMIAMANPLAALISGGKVDRQADIVGYFVNAALSNANSKEDARANMQSIFASFRITPEQAMSGLAQLYHAGLVQKEVAQAYLNGIESLVMH